jgi:Tfp pilus assembly protein PilN
MRELEFLPGWYPLLRKRRRILLVEAWLSVVIFLALCLWLVLSAHNVIAKESLLHQRQQQLDQSNAELQKLAELESLKKQMSEQARLMAQLGPNVPMGRLMDTIEQVLPREMALQDVTVEYQKLARTGPLPAHPVTEADPQYQVEIHGVAPNDVELGNFMTRLAQTIPHWVGGSMREADTRQNGHLLRDFTFSFSIKLNDEETPEK